MWDEAVTCGEDLHNTADDKNFDDYIWMIYKVNMHLGEGKGPNDTFNSHGTSKHSFAIIALLI